MSSSSILLKLCARALALFIPFSLWHAKAQAQVSLKIYHKAAQAMSHFEKGRQYNKLYGTVVNDDSVEKGRLACALVATIVLREAGVMESVYRLVSDMEDQLDKKVKTEEFEKVHPPFRQGDILVWWKPIGKDRKPSCRGQGDCHVGIFIGGENDTFMNVGGGVNEPAFVPNDVMPALGWNFKYAYRAR